MKQYRNYLIIATVALLVGRYVLQPKPKEVVKWKEKVVTQTKIKVVTRTVQKPDGTIIIDERIDENSSSKIERSGSKKTGSGITLGLLAVKDLNDFQKTNAEAIVVIPFFGNLKVVGSVSTTKQVGLGVALEF